MASVITQLNDYLFDQLNALTNEDKVGEELDEEIKRSKAVAHVASQIINNNNSLIRAVKVQSEHRSNETMNLLLEGGK